MANNPKAKDNLTPMKPGQTLNPNGAPRKPHFKTLLEKVLTGEITREEAGERRKMTAMEDMVMDLVVIARSKNITAKVKVKGKGKKAEEKIVLVEKEHPDKLKAMVTIMERMDGKPEQTVNTKIPTQFNLPVSDEEADLVKGS